LADPDEYPNLFEDWQIALNVEAGVAPKRFWFIYIFIKLHRSVKFYLITFFRNVTGI
jgi:hypothetical protein